MEQTIELMKSKIVAKELEEAKTEKEATTLKEQIEAMRELLFTTYSFHEAQYILDIATDQAMDEIFDQEEEEPKKMEVVYEPAKDTAKKIRKELKKAFPEIKFSVKSKTYSMGSSIRVEYAKETGIEREEVRNVTDQFKSSSFDGMQDMKISKGYMYEGVLYNGADYVFVEYR